MRPRPESGAPHHVASIIGVLSILVIGAGIELALAGVGAAGEHPLADPSMAQARSQLQRWVRQTVAVGDSAVHIRTTRAPFDYLYARSHARLRAWAIEVVVNDSTACPNDAVGDSLASHGWTREYAYQADGPDGETSAYLSRRLLCVLAAQWDGGDDSDTTVVPRPGCRVVITCVPRRADDVPRP